MNDTTPRYKHDCTRCEFLGQHESFDVYRCPTGLLGATYIARESDAEPDYAAWPEKLLLGTPSAHQDDALTAIRKFAQK